LSTGLFVSQVEAKNDKHDDNDKYKHGYTAEAKNEKHDGEEKNKLEYKYEHQQYNNRGGSVPIPGTLLFMGGGFAGLVAWRARRPRT
jgi:hypothetical protein